MIHTLLENCRQQNISSYVLRTSRMSVLNGAREDLRKLTEWISYVREAQLCYM